MPLIRGRIITIILSLSLLVPVSAFTGQAGAGKAKPASPLAVSIRPAQQGLTSAGIRPGDVVQLVVAANSRIAISRASIKVTLTGGAKLVAGDTRWSGALEKDNETALVITVSAPMTGKGTVKAMLSSGSLHAGAQFSLGPETKTKPAGSTGTKTKDSRGQDIIEYRK